MRICVTGGAGYIGSHTCKALARDGHELVVYDNLSTGHRSLARFGQFEHGDVKDTQRLRSVLRAFRPDAIIHFAATSTVGESVTNPGKYYRNNVCGIISTLEAMRDEGIGAIVVSGTSAVYGEPDKVPIPESAPKKPLSPYGATKLFMERILADFGAAHDIGWISLRYFNAAGSSPDGDIGELHDPETHLIPLVILAALGRMPPLRVFGDDYPTADGTCIRDYIDVGDLARAHIEAAGHLLAGGESQAINLGSQRGYSVLEILKGVERVSGRRVPFSMAPRRPGDPALLIADAARAKDVLGWEARVELEEMLANAWRFFSARS